MYAELVIAYVRVLLHDLRVLLLVQTVRSVGLFTQAEARVDALCAWMPVVCVC